MKIGRPYPGNAFDKAVKAVLFVQNNRRWTIQDLADHVGVHKNTAGKYLTVLSSQMPIMEIKPVRYGTAYGRLPALYGLMGE